MAGKSKQEFISETAARILAASIVSKEHTFQPKIAVEMAEGLAEELHSKSLGPWQLG